MAHGEFGREEENVKQSSAHDVVFLSHPPSVRVRTCIPQSFMAREMLRDCEWQRSLLTASPWLAKH